MKKILLTILVTINIFVLAGCGTTDANKNKPTEIFIQDETSNALKKNELINFDKISDFKISEKEVSEEDMTMLKSKYATKVDFVKYETTFSLVSVGRDMTGNYTSVFVYNNGQWSYSFGYLTNKEEWTYVPKEASRVDKQKMLTDLKEIEFSSFEKGFVGSPKNSSISIIKNREFDKSIYRDTINTSVLVKTDFAEYDIPLKMIYYFKKGEWILGDTEISDITKWQLKYKGGNEPKFLDDSIILSYLTINTNFLTYISNLEYVDNYSIEKKSEIANEKSVTAIYNYSVFYNNLGTVNYDVYIEYQWLNEEWSEGNVSVNFKDGDFSEFIKKSWVSAEGNSFIFTEAKLSDKGYYVLKGKYNNVDVYANLGVPLKDNNWEVPLFDSEGNQIWDIPSNSFSIDLQNTLINYNNVMFYPGEENVPLENINEEINTSNEIIFNKEISDYTNQITKDNLLLKNITVKNENNNLNISGLLINNSTGNSTYKISVVAFDEKDNIIQEGYIKSDSFINPSESLNVSILLKIKDISTLSNIYKIKIYISK